MLARKQARYEVKYIADTAQPQTFKVWWTYLERDRCIDAMKQLGWDVIRVTRLFQDGIRYR